MPSSRRLILISTPFLAEVVLAMLIEKFRFTLPDEEIVWRMTNIQTPALKGKEDETPQLPLKVSLA